MAEKPVDVKTVVARMVEIAAYIWIVIVALIAWALAAFHVAQMVLGEFGTAGLLTAAGATTLALMAVARGAKWYADRRQAKLELAAAENAEWEHR